MIEAIEAKPYLSKGGRIHYSYISGRKILNHIEYPESTELPKELIKFYSITENSVNAFTKGFLWAADPLTFNDPFDCPIQIWDKESFTMKNIQPILNPQNHFMLKEDDVLHNRSIFSELRFVTLGIICLHEFSLKNQDILWGYYTNQEGFAIKFDSHQLIKIWGVPFKVDYLKTHDLEHFNLNEVKNTEDLFPMFLRWSTQKKHVWKNENEWRFIFSNLEADTLFGNAPKKERSKKYNSSAIEEVILGLKFFHQTNMVEVSKHDSYYIIQGEQHKLHNEILSFLSFPSKITAKHMYMKVDELIITPRPCKIFNQNNGRFNIHYPLASEEEYKLAIKHLEDIFDAPIGSPQSEEANELVKLIDEYEQDQYPFDPKD